MATSRTPLTFAAAALGASLALAGPAAFAQSSATNPGMNGTMAPATNAAPAPMTTTKSTATKSAASTSSIAATRDARLEAHIKQLHSELKVTPDQESKWNDLAQVMRDNGQQMSSLIAQRNQEAQAKTPVSAVDNLRNYQQIADAHADGLKKLVPVFQSLYDSMSLTQKQTADKLFNQRISQRVRTTTATTSSGSHS